jgi:hypothetical protein
MRLFMTVALSLTLFACRTDPLEVPGGGPSDPAPQPTPPSTGACTTLTTAADCDARSDCYSEFSGDLPCLTSTCRNHFEKCVAGKPQCTGAACAIACPQLTPSCPSGDTPIYDNGPCCATGCAHAEACD